MGYYLPHTPYEIEEMLRIIGKEDLSQLFEDLDSSLQLSDDMPLPNKLSEPELMRLLGQLSHKNGSTTHYQSYLGGGAYEHFIPTTVDAITSRSEFYTAYTPYQPEISQGTLQAIFEYQTMICELTGMAVSNASHYDGGTATAEAVFLSSGVTRRDKCLVSSSVNPETLEVIKTYTTFKGIEMILLPTRNGVTDVEHFHQLLDNSIACVVLQTPNFWGNLEDVAPFEQGIHAHKGHLILNCEPISLAVLKSPAQWGADIAVGDGQPLGNALNFGGPSLGYMACTEKLMRKLPGRIVGKTVDLEGKTGYVLTLQAREQHIRRDKATSNITSNEALNALAATVYLATLGKEGLMEVARQGSVKAHYLADLIKQLPGFSLIHEQPFFNEFVVTCPVPAQTVISNMLVHGIFAGIDLSHYVGQSEFDLLICVTETKTTQNLLSYCEALSQVASREVVQ